MVTVIVNGHSDPNSDSKLDYMHFTVLIPFENYSPSNYE